MSKPSPTLATVERPHSPGRQRGLAKVPPPVDHHADDAEIIHQLSDAVAAGDRGRIVESAKRLVGHEAANNIPVPQLVSVEQIAMSLNLCTRSIWRLVGTGDLPQPIYVGSARRWYRSDIESYLRKLTEKRDGMKRHGRC